LLVISQYTFVSASFHKATHTTGTQRTMW